MRRNDEPMSSVGNGTYACIPSRRVVGSNPVRESTTKVPHSLDIDPSGRFLLPAGGSSGRLAVSRIDPDTGRLTGVHADQTGPMLWWARAFGREWEMVDSGR